MWCQNRATVGAQLVVSPVCAWDLRLATAHPMWPLANPTDTTSAANPNHKRATLMLNKEYDNAMVLDTATNIRGMEYPITNEPALPEKTAAQ